MKRKAYRLPSSRFTFYVSRLLILSFIFAASTASAAAPGDVLLILHPQADLRAAVLLPDQASKGRFVYQQATAVATHAQASLRHHLDTLPVTYRPYWLVNMIRVQGDPATLAALAQRPEVAQVLANTAVHHPLPPLQTPIGATAVSAQWNLSLINADVVWALGITGQGVVIGGQDTGVDWTHPALKSHYRGWNGGSANHTFSWHDAIGSSNARCPGKSPQPCDDSAISHGTHTVGIMVGDDGQGVRVGVAPGAQWIACRNMNQGVGTPATYIECYEWFVAPYPPDGDPFSDGDPSQAPQVINNSWTCPPFEGCTDTTVLQTAVQAVRQAGIVTVHAAGNMGPDCGTISDPAANYLESFTVGNSDANDAISFSSSRGPSSALLKPNVTAPGVGILATVRDDSYGVLTGTSMAAPHVAGVIALLLDANPALSGQVARLEQIVQQTAVPHTSTQPCGGLGSTAVPNNVYGYGRVDALRAVAAALPYQTHLPIVVSP